MTITLKAKKLHEEISLLQDYQKLVDMLEYFGRPSFQNLLTVSHESGDEFFEISLQHSIIKRALSEQKIWTATELEKRGINIE